MATAGDFRKEEDRPEQQMSFITLAWERNRPEAHGAKRPNSR